MSKTRAPRLSVVASKGSVKRDEPHFVDFTYGNGAGAMHSEQHPDYWKAERAARAIRRAALLVATQPIDETRAAAPRQKVVDRQDEDSSLLLHARQELERAGMFDEDSDYGGMIGEAVLQLVALFSTQGHSGSSAGMVIDLLGRLLAYLPLTPLTSDPGEWLEVTDGMWQSTRRPDAFSADGGKTYYLVDDKETVFDTDATAIEA